MLELASPFSIKTFFYLLLSPLNGQVQVKFYVYGRETVQENKKNVNEDPVLVEVFKLKLSLKAFLFE